MMDIQYYKEQLAAKEDMLVRTSSYLLEAQVNLEQKNKELSELYEEIFDSIRFARLIQTSFLPNEDVLKVFLKDASYLVKQQIGIGGDLVFSKNTGHGLVFGLLDSTGHGIPASMLSIAGSLIIQEITSTMQIDSPATLAKLLNYQLYSTFNKTELSLAQMEGSIFYYCSRTGKLKYSSAKGKSIYIPLTGDIIELPTSKDPVGQSPGNSFDENEIPFITGDKLLIYSDGLVDQFGGPLDKKYTRKRLLELMNSNRHCDVHELKEIIELEHTDWKGERSQTDDLSFLIIEL
jgi:serine phosphatase RsbU (regulator of sigma subunit)